MNVLPGEWRTLLATALVVVATLASGGGALASGGATLATEEAGTSHVPTERPTENVEQRLTLDFYEDRSEMIITAFITYPARNSAEAEAAREETLDPDWFRADERLESVHSQIADDDESLPDGLLSIRHTQSSSRTPNEPRHGWVILVYDTHWTNFADGSEDIRIGDPFVEAFGPDWLLEVTYPDSWEPATINGDPFLGADGKQGLSQTWNLSDDPETPLIVFERSEIGDTDDSLALGPAGGIGPATLALLLVVLGATAHRVRSEGT